MRKPVAGVSERPDADLPDQRSRTASAWRAAFEGFSTLNLNPSPGLRRFRYQLQDYSDTAVISAWSSTVRALAAVTDAELHLHGADQLDRGPGIKAILRRVDPWEQPDPQNQNPEKMETEPSEMTILLEGPDGPVEVTVPGATTRERLLEILRTIAMEPQKK